MTRGRKPRAIEVQEASGAFVKDPQRPPQHVIKADRAVPEPPKIVQNCNAAMEIWEETVDILQETGILSRTDTHLLTNYCITYAEWLKAAEWVQENGHTTPDGKTAPQSAAMIKLAAQHKALIPELGLSPSGRARLSVAGGTVKKDRSGIEKMLDQLKDVAD